MPPKKGGKKGKKSDLDPATLEAKEQLLRADAEIDCLNRQLDFRQTQVQQAQTSEREWRAKVHEYTEAYQAAQEETLDITSDMSRQYRAMKESLTAQMRGLEGELQGVRAQLEVKDEEMRKVREDCEQKLKEKDNQIRELNMKMEDLAHEFSEMLKETLEKMSERLESEV